MIHRRKSDRVDGQEMCFFCRLDERRLYEVPDVRFVSFVDPNVVFFSNNPGSGKWKMALLETFRTLIFQGPMASTSMIMGGRVYLEDHPSY